MKKILLLLGILSSSGAFAQTKIKDGTIPGSVTPNAAALLELESNNKGLLLTRVELANTSTWGLTGTGTQGMMVYNTSAAIASTDAAYPVLAGGKGVYYWDGTGWVGTKTAAGLGPWNVESTSTSATLNTQNIYQNGNVGIGDFSVANPIAKLDVRGAVRTGGSTFWINPPYYYPYPDTPHIGVVGINSVAMGYANEASGFVSFATGMNSVASGDFSTSMGVNTTASGNAAIALGVLSTASGVSSMAMGERATASGQFATAIGHETSAVEYGSTAIGHRAYASKPTAMALGLEANARGNTSMAIGASTEAIGNNSIAVGYYSDAIGNNSMAIGNSATSYGENSVAIGTNTNAFGKLSTSMGTRTIAPSQYEIVFGYKNAIITGDTNDVVLTDPLLQVGNGFPTAWLSDDPPSNALTILKNGNTKIGGLHNTKPNLTLEIEGTDGVKVPVGTTAERPAAAAFGTLRYNTTTGRGEMYVNDVNGDGTQGDAGWRPI